MNFLCMIKTEKTDRSIYSTKAEQSNLYYATIMFNRLMISWKSRSSMELLRSHNSCHVPGNGCIRTHVGEGFYGYTGRLKECMVKNGHHLYDLIFK